MATKKPAKGFKERFLKRNGNNRTKRSTKRSNSKMGILRMSVMQPALASRKQKIKERHQALKNQAIPFAAVLTKVEQEVNEILKGKK